MTTSQKIIEAFETRTSKGLRVMRWLRWLIVGAGLSLLALSILLHYRIDAPFDFGAPPAAVPTGSDGTIRIRKFGIEQTFIIRVFDTRAEADSMCGSDNIMQWEVITPTESKDGRYSCRSELP
jgi:hypothetical protein